MIAEFMGFPTQTDAVDDRVLAYYIGDVIKADNSGNENEENVFHPDDMKFHTSWDWLMPVVEEVRTTDLKGTIMENIYSTYVVFPLTYSTEIYRVYDRVVEFIEWYNENK